MIVSFMGVGKGSSTSSMLAVAGVMAMDGKHKVMISQTYDDSSLSSKFLSNVEFSSIREMEMAATSSHLDIPYLQSTADVLLPDQLYFIGGQSTSGVFEKTYPYIIEKARKAFDISFVDLNKTSGELKERLIKISDILVVVGTQDLSALSNLRKSELMKSPKAYFCLSPYHENSKSTIRKVSNFLGIPKNRSGAVPFNTRYMDSLNSHTALSFLSSIVERKKKLFSYDPEADFIDHIRKFYGKLVVGP